MQKHLNPRIEGLVPSPTLAINERCRELRRQGKEIFHFGFGQSPFPVPKLLTDELKENAFQKDYLPVRGLPELRSEVAKYFLRTQKLDFTQDDILVGPGSKELMFLLQLVTEADLILPAPTWVSYCPQAHILGRTVHWIETQYEDNWRIDPKKLDEFLENQSAKRMLFVLTSPGNPTGVAYSTEQLEQIALVAKKHRLLVLSDEIYGELHHRAEHTSIAQFYPEGTIVSSGLSKWCGAGGWRLGVFGFPPNLQWILKAMASVASETYSTTSAPIQFAAIPAFSGLDATKDYVSDVSQALKCIGNWISERLLAKGVRVAPPDGAYYLFPDFSEVMKQKGKRFESSLDFCESLLEEIGVALLPGECFGRPKSEMSARLAYVDFDGQAVLDYMQSLPSDESPTVEKLRTLCPRVFDGIDAICHWLSQS